MERPTTAKLEISVHALAEFIFCRRAFLNAFLDEHRDDGREPILRLNYQPSYELMELESRLNALATTVFQLLIVGSFFFAIGAGLGYLIHWGMFLGGLGATAVVGRQIAIDLGEVFRLMLDHSAAQRALAKEPNTKVRDDESVDWWSLRAAGFTSLPCDRVLRDDRLGLIGRPWRILRRGDLAIPAYVRSSKKELQPQQRARIAAYCHLIRQNEGAECPFGIILDAGTFKGTAIKTSSADAGLLRKYVEQARRCAEEFLRHDQQPKQPELPSLCHECSHGRPRLVQIGESETKSRGVAEPAMIRRSPATGKGYHCSCGDRFGWTPPHQVAVALKLL